MDNRLSDLSHMRRRSVEAWTLNGFWGRPALWWRVRERASQAPDRRCVADDTGAWTWRELWDRARQSAHALRAAGLTRGDIVLVQLPNWREYVELLVATEALGLIFAFCPASWGERETVRALALLRPRAWFVGKAKTAPDADWVAPYLEAAQHHPSVVVNLRAGVAPGSSDFETWRLGGAAEVVDFDAVGGGGLDPLEIAVTSGTTGDPKGVLHVHDSALATVQSTIDRQGVTSADVIHVAVPVGHTFGYFFGVRFALQAGAMLVLQERWAPARAVELIEQHRATVSLGPAAFIVDLLGMSDTDLERLGSLRVFTQSGDPLPRPVAERAVARLPFRISRALGMTEFGHVASTDASSPPERVLDSAGSPQAGITIDIRDQNGASVPAGVTGRVFVAGPFLFAGYMHMDHLDREVLDERGFLCTGDLGWLGDDNYLHITGREKNIIRRGAVTIPTAAVEDAIASHPAIKHAVVIALQDDRLGEVPVACVQMVEGGTPFDLAALQKHLEAAGVTRTFWPEQVRIVAQWPVGPTAKIDRAQLVSLFA